MASFASRLPRVAARAIAQSCRWRSPARVFAPVCCGGSGSSSNGMQAWNQRSIYSSGAKLVDDRDKKNPVIVVDEDSQSSQRDFEEKVLDMQQQAQREAATRMNEMVRLFGGAEDNEMQAVLSWLHTYYVTPHPEFIVPAMQIISRESSMTPQLELAFLHFATKLLQGMFEGEPEGETANKVITDFFSRCVLVDGVRPDLILAVLHLVDTQISWTCSKQLTKSIEQKDGPDSDASRMGHAVSIAPRIPIESWPVPGEDIATARAVWLSEDPLVYEVAGFFQMFRRDTRAVGNGETPVLPQDASVDSADKAFGVWVTVTSSSVVEALWSSFYATGDTKYLERVVELALPWLEYELEVGFQRLVEPNMDMPDSLSGTSDNALRAQCARSVASSILVNAVQHSAVMQFLSTHSAKFADALVPEPYRQPGVTFGGTTEDAALNRAVLCSSLAYVILTYQSTATASQQQQPPTE